MGLCKCPRKKLTNQFCFEHATNVCEHCMVQDHPRCIIQSYLKWLDNSEYNPVCQVCSSLLSSGECIRLVCYDVFHKECLNSWASRLPPNTAPAGYKCPVCSQPVFPAANLVSPVADHLRETLAVYPWARTGLGLPLIEEKRGQEEPDWSSVNGAAVTESDDSASVHVRPAVSQAKPPGEASTPHTQDSHLRVNTHGGGSSSGGVGGGVSSGVRVTAMEDPPITPSQFRDTHHHHHASSSTAAATTNTSVVRKGSSSETKLLLNEDIDVDESENKYKRRSAVEWFSRWWRTMNRPATRHHQGFVVGVRRMAILLAVLGCVTLFVVLSYLGRGASDDDPLLDPFNNPNIHVEGE